MIWLPLLAAVLYAPLDTAPSSTRIPPSAAASPRAAVDAPGPASVLVFPTHHAGPAQATLLAVTNTSGSKEVMAFYHYVNAEFGRHDPLKPKECSVFCRGEVLTPSDTVTVLTGCHNAGGGHGGATQGYLVVAARSTTSGAPIAHDYLVGSQIVVSFATGCVYSLLPVPFEAVPADGAPTDVDGDGRLDFDDVEYEALPDALHLDSFLGVAESRLVLVDMSGLEGADVAVAVSLFNDNEFPLSVHFTFRCWFEVDLSQLSTAFTDAFLRGTPHDPAEVDIGCDGHGDFEGGWARIDATSATLGGRRIANPPVLGALVGGPFSLEAGRLLWGSRGTTPGEF